MEQGTRCLSGLKEALSVAHAYTPGITVSRNTLVRKERMLPIEGSVLVKRGDVVAAETVVARAHLPGSVSSVNVVAQLGIAPSRIRDYMTKQEGDPVEQGEVIAATRSRFKWFRTFVRAPMAGTVETISAITGQVLIRHPPRPVEVSAYIDGSVTAVIERIGVVIEAKAAYIQGIFGVGGEAIGTIMMACDRPEETPQPEMLGSDMQGAIVVAGERITSRFFTRAHEIGVAALIAGSIHDSDLTSLLGYEIGVAITGQETIRPVLIITEGFGKIPMAQGTFDLLRSLCGRKASVNGATQIRAGVVRPEIIVSWHASDEKDTGASPQEPPSTDLTVGTQVRIIREPYFGKLGTVESLPCEFVSIETEARVRVAELRLADGTRVIVPRANIELIQRS